MFEQIYGTLGTNSSEWDNSTLLLYLFLFFSSFFIGWLIQHTGVIVCRLGDRTLRPVKHINYFWFISFFLFLLFFSGFRDVGTDLPVYRDIFLYVNDRSVMGTNDNEPGFILMNKILRYFINDVNIAIFLFSALSLIFMFKAMNYYSEKIDLSIAMFAFLGLFYFQSFNLLRIYMVSYFLCYEFKNLIEGHIWKYFFIVFFCVFFHYSAILMVLPILAYIIQRKSSTCFILLLLVVFVSSYLILPYLSFLNLFERYSSYMEDSMNGGIGIAQIAYHLPLFLLYFYMNKQSKYSKILLDLLLVYSSFSFLFGMLGYKILMIGRMSIYFSMLFVIIVPYLIRSLRDNGDKYYSFVKVFFILYVIFRCHMYFKEYLFADSIMPYKIISL